VAVELVEGIDAKAVAGDCLQAGLVLNAVTPTALRLAPPLTITEAEIDEAVAVLSDVLARHLNRQEGR
jgi:4-aminobutyrate aminotransferase-like enzyme